MSKAQQSLSLAVVKRIDAVCDRFEAGARAGAQPRIEEYLGSATGDERAELLRALLRLELEIRSGTEAVAARASVYETRFPDLAGVVQSVFRELSERTQAQPDASLDTSVSRESVRSGAGGKAGERADLPKRIGRFEVIAVLGQGAFGKVYRARDPQLDREVAIKVPLLETPDDIARFRREAQAAATLHHPNVCPVHEVGQDVGGGYYIVMAYVDGKTLAEHLKERKEPLPARQAVLIIRKLALALETAHGKGIVHRDLKPANIMIGRERKDVIITDFGLARRRKNGDAFQTKEGMVMGTPAYMAPEQARGDVQAVGPASDIYALGVILYEMLAGRPPFAGSIAEVFGQLMHVVPPPPSEHRLGVDPRLDAVCARALAKEPGKRYKSMKDLADALDRFLKEASAAETPAKPATADVDSARLTRVAAALSDERKQETREAIEEAVRRARIPLWKWLAGAGFMAAVIMLGIIFFARTPNATVLIQVDVDLKDAALSFFLDGKAVPAEALARPIELTVGKHELLVKRGERVERRFTFTVSRDAGPRITVDEDETVRPRPKTITPPPQTPYPANLLTYLNLPGVDDAYPFLTPDGLSIYFTREGPKHDASGIYHARRPSVKEPFGKPVKVLDGRHIAVTADECYAVVLARGVPAPLLQVKRASRDVPWEAPKLISEFKVQWNIKSPWLSPDGLTLVFQRKRTVSKYPGGASEIVITRRAKRQDRWGPVELLPLADDPRLTEGLVWPRLSDDQKTLWFGHGGGRDNTTLMTATRLDVQSPFGNYRTIDIGGKAVQGQSPFYVPATKELFWSWDSTGTKNDNDLRVALVDPPVHADTAWTALFNGTDLTGWHVESGDPGQWEVQESAIVARSVGSARRNYLLSDKDYQDFMLRLEFMIVAGGGGGVVVRALEGEMIVGNAVDHPIIKLNDHARFPNYWSGTTHFLKDEKQHAKPAKEPNVAPNVWHAAEITVRGDACQVVLAGNKVVDTRLNPKHAGAFVPGLKRAKGKIGMQAHTGTMRYRAIQIKELSEPVREADGFIRLFNGKDLTGWKTHPEAPGDWRVENGILIGRFKEGSPKTHSQLFTERGDYKDVIFRAETKINKGGNSGLHVRIPFTAELGGGYEAQINSTHQAQNGSLFIKGGVASVLVTDKLVPPDTWFMMEIQLVGNHVTIAVNDKKVVDYLDTDNTWQRGHLSLQVHNPSTVVEFRNVEVKELQQTGDPARAAAVWLLQRNALLQIEAAGQRGSFRAADSLPAGELRIVEMEGSQCPALTDEALVQLAPGLKHLEQLRGNNMAFTGTGFSAWRGQQHLRVLSCVGAKGSAITDAGLEQISGLSALQELNVASDRVTDAGLAHLSKLPRLTTLELTRAKLSDPGVARLQNCPKLLHFRFYQTTLGDGALAALAKMPLESLVFLAPNVTDTGVAHLGQCKTLKLLNLGTTQISDVGLDKLHGLKNLQTLKVGKTRVTPAGIERLRKALPSCQVTHSGDDSDRRVAEWITQHGGKAVLSMKGAERDLRRGDDVPTEPFRVRRIFFHANHDDEDLKRLVGLSELEYLLVAHSLVQGHGLAHLKSLPNLRGLAMHGPQGLPENIKHIADLKELRSLEIDGRGVNDDSLFHFKELVNLESLDLVNSFEVTGRGCVHLKDLLKLRWIDFRNNQHDDEALSAIGQMKQVQAIAWGSVERVTDKGLAGLAGAASLRNVNLHRSQITDDGLKHLKAFKELRMLNLSNTKISDAGVVHLRPLTSLENLDVRGTRLGAASIAALKATLAKCKIEHD